MHRPQDFSWAIGPFIIIFTHLGSLLWFVKAALRTWQSGTSVSTAAGKSSSKALRFPCTNFESSQKNKIPILSGIACRESVGNKNGAQVWVVKKVKKNDGFYIFKKLSISQWQCVLQDPALPALFSVLEESLVLGQSSSMKKENNWLWKAKAPYPRSELKSLRIPF